MKIVDGGEWWASRPGCFTPVDRAHSTHSIGDYVGSRTGLDTEKKRKSPNHTPAFQPVAYR
jgi:hypothetical protein